MNIQKIYKKMPAVLKRTAWGKSIGFALSLAWFLIILLSGSYGSNPMLAWGILFWYPTVGAFIGLAGVMDQHPLLGKMWIWRGVTIGAFMNVLLVLLAYVPLMNLLTNMWYDFTGNMIMMGAIIEGAIIGGAMDWYLTAKFGEGKKLMKKGKIL